MSARSRLGQIGRVGTVVAVAALGLAGPGAVFAAQAASTASSGSPTLTLNGVDRNSAGLTVSNVPFCPCSDVNVAVYDGDAKMPQVLDGNPRGYVDAEAVSMNDLVRGATYNLSVRYTDKSTGAVVEQTNTVTFTTPPSTDTQPPTAPTNIKFVKTAEPSGPNSYNISWTASTDNVDGSNVQYVVRRNGQVTGPVTDAVNGDVFTVTAIDRSDNATTSAPVTFNGPTGS